MDCSNSGPPILRWPYYQDISHPGRTIGHCPWCMETFPIGQDVPNHEVGVEDVPYEKTMQGMQSK